MHPQPHNYIFQWGLDFLGSKKHPLIGLCGICSVNPFWVAEVTAVTCSLRKSAQWLGTLGMFLACSVNPEVNRHRLIIRRLGCQFQVGFIFSIGAFKHSSDLEPPKHWERLGYLDLACLQSPKLGGALRASVQQRERGHGDVRHGRALESWAGASSRWCRFWSSI